MTYVVTLQHKDPCTAGHEIYKSNTPFLGHDYYILSVISVWEFFLKKIPAMHLQQYYMTDMATSQHRKPCFKGHEMYNSTRPSLFITSLHLFCVNHASEQRRRVFKKYINFPLASPKLSPDPLEMGRNENYNFLFPSPTDATNQIW